MPDSESREAADQLAHHLVECRGVDTALVGGTGVDMTPTVQALLDAGWTYEGTEHAGGKRIRYLRAPAREEDR